MRKVVLRMNEENKYDVIKKVVNNQLSILTASVKLNMSIRSIYRLIKLYRVKGKEGFIHGNRDRKPAKTINEETKKRIIDLFKEKYYDCNFKHFKELLSRMEGINISYNALYCILKTENVLSPKAQRNTIKNYNKMLKEKKKNNVKLNDVELAYFAETNLDDNQNYHPRKSRKKYFGELAQMDACQDYWFGGIKSHLHVAIDDAKGHILGAYFDLQETLNGYYHVLYNILTTEGIPVEILTDNRTVFNYERHKDRKEENNTLTQFSYACHVLGTKVSTSSVPQVKGRVERLFNTLLSRLPVELRLAGITDIESANKFLPTFIEQFNEQFAAPIDYSKSVFTKQDDINVINYALSIIAPRVVDKGSAIKFKNKYYQFYNEGKLVAIAPKTKCMVMLTYNGEMVAAIDDKIYDLFELERNKLVSSNFDVDCKVPEKPKRNYKPKASHPWGYQRYINKIKRYYAVNETA